MSVPGIRLESVRRKTGGRIHLTPRVPASGPVTTLCGQTLAAGSYSGVSSASDCANCTRRSTDRSRISSAFFEQEEGTELLRLSLEQARFRKPAPREAAREAGRGAASQAAPPVKAGSRPVVVPPPAVPDRVGDLMTGGFKAAGNGVWRSPGGVVVRMSGKARDRFAELVFDGATVATRLEDGIRLRAGDVEVTASGDDVVVQIKRR